MDLRKLSSDAIGLFAAGALVSLVGWYTENQGFVWAGSIFFVVASGLLVREPRVGKRGD